APGREEGVVDHVLGGPGLAEDPIREGEAEAAVAVVEGGERGEIARCQVGDEGVVRRGGLFAHRSVGRHRVKRGLDGGGKGGGTPPAKNGVLLFFEEKQKRPERPTSVPCRCFEAQRPGRGADPRYPLGPPLMLSPVALPGTGPLMESPVPSLWQTPRDEGDHT